MPLCFLDYTRVTKNIATAKQRKGLQTRRVGKPQNTGIQHTRWKCEAKRGERRLNEIPSAPAQTPTTHDYFNNDPEP